MKLRVNGLNSLNFSVFICKNWCKDQIMTIFATLTVCSPYVKHCTQYIVCIFSFLQQTYKVKLILSVRSFYVVIEVSCGHTANGIIADFEFA